ncbi:hypothetical protein V2I59_25175, partial [Pseudomonas viridiflava]|uniref:hypothetical protein n=1 Tax=Pseudomonas viridiflava TaxID=33069 RepID=UPI002EC50E40|nr:hypothetical protein [Pseudomonas viridiflava]
HRRQAASHGVCIQSDTYVLAPFCASFRPVYNAARGTMGTVNILPNGVTRLHASTQSFHVTVYNVMDEGRNL